MDDGTLYVWAEKPVGIAAVGSSGDGRSSSTVKSGCKRYSRIPDERGER